MNKSVRGEGQRIRDGVGTNKSVRGEVQRIRDGVGTNKSVRGEGQSILSISRIGCCAISERAFTFIICSFIHQQLLT